MKPAALIVAAGRGTRMGSELPKQYLPLGGIALVARAVDAFVGMPVHVVIGAGQEAMLAAALAGRTVASVTIGGTERQNSVRAGLSAVAAAGASHVLIHDAARPLLPRAVIDRLLVALKASDGAIPVLPVDDTLSRGQVTSGGNTLGETVDRNGLCRVQTPQAFALPAIMAAHDNWAGEGATDDAQIARRHGMDVALVAGDALLDKLTHGHQLAVLERQGGQRIGRTGSGFDVHRFEPGLPLWICGVPVPHSHGAVGHSDADVGLHALTDALLGTIGAGDIGTHFPPSDPQWRGARSPQFVRHALNLVAQAGGRVEHVDLTLICEAPKIGPYRAAMRLEMARILELDIEKISLKATTTEGLGFTGRGEGIAAQAMATISFWEWR